MIVSELIAQLQTLPPDKSILCQLVGTMGSRAWSMEFAFLDIPKSTFVQLEVKHGDLLDLPDINFGSGKKYPPVTNPATAFKEFEGSLNLTNEEKQQLRMFIATGDTSFDMGNYRFVRINRGGSMAIEFFKHTEPLVSYPLAYSQYSE